MGVMSAGPNEKLVFNSNSWQSCTVQQSTFFPLKSQFFITVIPDLIRFLHDISKLIILLFLLYFVQHVEHYPAF